MKLRVRAARDSDLMLIFKWANDSLTRGMSFSQDAIPLETHKEWFSKVLSLRNTLFIVEGYQAGSWLPIGTIRFDKDGEVSMSLANEFRGQHLATPVIKAGIAHIKRILTIDKLVAHIKHENIRSVKAFESAGFQFACETTVREHPCLEYIYQNKDFRAGAGLR